MNKLVQPRKAMQRTVLISAVLFSSLVLAMGIVAVDGHWALLVIFGVALVVAVGALGPVVYALEARNGTRLRLHRPFGVVDLDVADGFEVSRARRGAGRLVLSVGRKRYPLFGSLGTPELVDEWIRRAQRS